MLLNQLEKNKSTYCLWLIREIMWQQGDASEYKRDIMDNDFNNEKYTFKQPYLENIQIDCMLQNCDFKEFLLCIVVMCRETGISIWILNHLMRSVLNVDLLKCLMEICLYKFLWALVTVCRYIFIFRSRIWSDLHFHDKISQLNGKYINRKLEHFIPILSFYCWEQQHHSKYWVK